jgi:hypothetical protein
LKWKSSYHRRTGPCIEAKVINWSRWRDDILKEYDKGRGGSE